MAPEVVWSELPTMPAGLRVLDPMAGSGTTLVTARLRGHRAIGFDSDPLAVLLSSTWTANIHPGVLRGKAQDVLRRAKALVVSGKLKGRDAFPAHADTETRNFLRYWFDLRNRRQLTALSQTIRRIQEEPIRNLLWCAFSRMIITKNSGVSLAMDVSHSRPHRKFSKAPVVPFAQFLRSVEYVIKASPFSDANHEAPDATIRNADARCLPVRANSIDIVITSPPYLNAIDYIRGHKLSLVWMGHSISALRALRSTNIGTETGRYSESHEATNKIVRRMCDITLMSNRRVAMLRQYVCDMRSMIGEIHRVLRPNGKAVLVIGDCNIGNTFVENSRCLRMVGKQAGLEPKRTRRRLLPENRRYLPPPTSIRAGIDLQRRMREEVILTFRKPALRTQ
jgi:hypothetical protein